MKTLKSNRTGGALTNLFAITIMFATISAGLAKADEVFDANITGPVPQTIEVINDKGAKVKYDLRTMGEPSARFSGDHIFIMGETLAACKSWPIGKLADETEISYQPLDGTKAGKKLIPAGTTVLTDCTAKNGVLTVVGFKLSQ